MSEKQYFQKKSIRSNSSNNEVIGPTGAHITIDDLPKPNTKRWVIRRKAEVVAGVNGGLISLKDALIRYNLSLDEFRSWQRLFDTHGMRGLRTTKVNLYRSKSWQDNKIGIRNSINT